MQIKLENIKYGRLNNINFKIENNKITGIISSDLYLLNDINHVIKNDVKDSGRIKYEKSENKIGLVSINNLVCTSNLNIEKFNDVTLELLDVDEGLFQKKFEYLSTTEKVKVLFLECLSKNPDTILVDCVLEELDREERKKIIKLLLNLKKFESKTIVISSIDIDLIFELVDNLVIIDKDNCFQSKDKFSTFDDLSSNILIKRPFVAKIENMVNMKTGINLGKSDNINELIKSIYREIR